MTLEELEQDREYCQKTIKQWVDIIIHHSNSLRRSEKLLEVAQNNRDSHYERRDLLDKLIREKKDKEPVKRTGYWDRLLTELKDTLYIWYRVEDFKVSYDDKLKWISIYSKYILGDRPIVYRVEDYELDESSTISMDVFVHNVANDAKELINWWLKEKDDA